MAGTMGASTQSSSSDSYTRQRSISDMLSQAISQSAGGSQGMSASDSASVGGSTSTTAGGSESLSESRTGQRIFGAQRPALEQLYGGAQGLIEGQAGIGDASDAVAAPLVEGARGYRETLQSLSDPAALIEAQTTSLREGLGRLYADTLEPEAEQAAIAAGGLGGVRQGVAQGVAQGEIARRFTEGHGAITASARAQAAQAAQAGLAGLGTEYDLGMARFAAEASPLQAAAGIIGGPTTLTSSRAASSGTSFTQGQSEAFNRALSSGRSVTEAWNEAMSMSRSEARQRSRSRGESRSDSSRNAFHAEI